MNFSEIAEKRQSCRCFNPEKKIDKAVIETILKSALIAPSACNAQPYHITVCEGQKAQEVAKATMGMGLNKFTVDAPVLLVISEESYNMTSGIGSKIKDVDYRSIDIGILSAYITSEATAQGIESCIIGWLNDKEIRKICNLKNKVHLVIALGYPKDNYELREKKRKSKDELVSFIK